MKLSVCRAIESGVTDGSVIFVLASSHKHCPLILVFLCVNGMFSFLLFGVSGV